VCISKVEFRSNRLTPSAPFGEDLDAEVPIY
jgi:hypothetical protein